MRYATNIALAGTPPTMPQDVPTPPEETTRRKVAKPRRRAVHTAEPSHIQAPEPTQTTATARPDPASAFDFDGSDEEAAPKRPRATAAAKTQRSRASKRTRSPDPSPAQPAATQQTERAGLTAAPADEFEPDELDDVIRALSPSAFENMTLGHSAAPKAALPRFAMLSRPMRISGDRLDELPFIDLETEMQKVTPPSLLAPK